ncbi:sugar ABC transporter permease [Paenibacillus mucilaginosus]|uniref:Binding-protein-dependent transport system inner membrane component n=2 Tax=Paenibacillus mucilaginosus TaxID=61624 RepID=H6NFQ2_9BACL|nr:sugar ABC transporter permease [Paenibacillus mucilaginosus]AEI43000.1 binding-protein-dependent transport system inner membrane component [Paenibacillus mucilaginosus KNP414]AFC30692.1 binding-protein-dependent transport system inner membrane component [Paenibacillus mucilaginosus 3016]MCG7216113.1 sugar ABC transporter permease [Paenibacillus mucilaginosus]WDM24628.1 sugar ABC transporter permease [Paenibacillus mucilaginosus]WFA19302.1 sugar ABC transporter permease [Paenibacillus mucila
MNLRLILTYVILAAASLASLYPALWILLSSFKTGTSLYSETLLPQGLTLDHYRELLSGRKYDYLLWFRNTLKVAVFSTLFGTFLTLLGSYAVARFRFVGRRYGLMGLLVLNMFPGFMSMIAIYVFLLQLNLLNSHWALILVYSSGSFLSNVFVAKGFYDTIPRSLDEAARIDGATNWQIFTRIMIPLSKPMLTYVSLVIFNGAWVDFIFAKLILRTGDKTTLAIGLYDMVSRFNSTDFTIFAAGAVLLAVPVMILFIWLQRFLVDGLTAGAAKG